MKVFVCEDEKEIAEIIKTILEKQNHEVKLDFGGNKILESIMNFTPNLIILDYRLPNLDGEKLTNKKNPRGHNLGFQLFGKSGR
jgi:DNA-binding response OmpR family regulator